MRVRFYASRGPDHEIKPQVHGIADALSEAARDCGDEFEIVHNAQFSGPADHVDVACTWGIFGIAREILTGYLGAGKRVLMFDKALFRRLGGNEKQGYFRVGIDGPSPVKYLMRTLKSWERWEAHRVVPRPRQVLDRRRGAIIYAGSSQKYCDFYGLGNANDYAESVFAQIREMITKAELVYRPKPSWLGARSIDGTRLSTVERTLQRELSGAYALITHGSAAAIEAIISGVPVVTLGPCAAGPVASHSIDDDLRNLRFPSDEARFHWLCNVAWCQWNLAELRSGEAWEFLRGELAATR